MTLFPAKPDQYPRPALAHHECRDEDMGMLYCRACGWASYPIWHKDMGKTFGAPFRCRGTCGGLAWVLRFHPTEWREAYERASVSVGQDQRSPPT